mgnify:CR=1 FL=1
MKPIVHKTYSWVLYAFFILFFLFTFLLISFSFKVLGFTRIQILIISLASLLGSSVNIPVAKLKSKVPIMIIKAYRFFGIEFYVPFYSYEDVTVAVNLGGALVPVFASSYLILAHLSLWPSFLLSTLLVTLFVHLLAKPVKGVGIVTPFFLPPILAALVGLALGGSMAPVVAYVSGTLGALIGADLLNLNKIDKLGSSFVSIGGAGVFDGVFLTGLVAALLAF